MTLFQRKIPILPTVNDVPSVSGQEHHPNSALLCANYNSLIDNELSNFETNITLLSQAINNLQATMQDFDLATDEYTTVFDDLNTAILALKSQVNSINASLPPSYLQTSSQFISNAVTYGAATTYAYNSSVLDGLNILYPLTFKKRTRIDAFAYTINIVLPVNNGFYLQIYKSDAFGLPGEPLRNIVVNDSIYEASTVGTLFKPLPELENILWQQGEIAWILFRVHKVGTGNLTGSFRALNLVSLPLLPEIINNTLGIAYTATNQFDLNLDSPLSRAAFLPSTNTYPSLIFRTTNL